MARTTHVLGLIIIEASGGTDAAFFETCEFPENLSCCCCYCCACRNEATSLWLLLVLSVLGVGGIWVLARFIMKRRSGSNKPLQVRQHNSSKALELAGGSRDVPLLVEASLPMATPSAVHYAVVQKDTEFGRFDLLSMDERHVSDFDDDV